MAELRNPKGILGIDGDSLGLLSDEALDFGDTGQFRFTFDSSSNQLKLNNTNTGNTVWSVNVGDENISLNGSNTITNVPNPTSANQIANKSFVEASIQGLTIKGASEATTNGSNIDLTSATDPNPIDGFTLSNGNRVLLKDQTDATENGIYVANTATDPTTWTRATDFDEDSEVVENSLTFIQNGTQNGGSRFIVKSSDPISVGSDGIVWEQFSFAGNFSAGDGLNLVDKEFSVNVSEFDGAFLSDDGSNNLDVDVARGLENDGSGNIQVDEDTAYNFTNTINFSSVINAASGVDVQGDITDGVQIIWDVNAQEIPDSAMGTIDTSTLAADTIGINTNDGLSGGGTQNLGGTFGLDVVVSDLVGRGIEADGSNNFQFDEDTTYTFTSRQSFSSGLEAAGDGVKLFYGAGLDMSTRYDAAEDELKWRDETNGADRMSLARTTGDLVIDGTLDETSSP